MKRLESKVAIVTGSTSGIGKATAIRFAQEGAKVVVTGRNQKRAQQVVEEIRKNGGEAIFVIADMSKYEDIEKIFNKTMKKFNTVDILFNNAGMLNMSPLMDLSIDEWRKVFSVNVDAAFILTQLVATVMQKKGKGKIINTCSVASFGAHHGYAAYVASKHAIAGLTKSIAWELGPKIKCNGIAPGLIHTAMVDSIGGPSALQQMIDQCPVKRCGEGDDIANLAVYLASDECDFLDGQIIKVDGGFEI